MDTLMELKKKVELSGGSPETARVFRETLAERKKAQRQALRDVAAAAAKLAMDAPASENGMVSISLTDLNKLCEELVTLNQIDKDLNDVGEFED
ncbi:hypothetical protein H1S01_09405 [Heliobacterium chlorum]|uniref:Uncharacterized protein n=1 Tax=Heliobacterium chlorum TaxID=2698 RepID=A0ABR7T305_HELCL|nr:hypothetical protein [Heliobacterium chlorum]MBC9784725.1 hypothetical protein [Heliobacterium chlorum]